MDCDLTDLYCSPSGTAEPGPVELVPGVWLSTLARSRDPAKRSWFVLWGSGSCSQCPPPQHYLYFPGPAWIRQPGPKKRARGSGGERWGDTSLGRPWGSGTCYGRICSLTRGQQGAGWGGLPAEGPGHNCCLPLDTHTDCGLSFLQHSEITAGLQQGEPISSSSSPAQNGAMQEAFCAICRDATPDTFVVPCEHHFCLRCILQWTLRKFTCPLCRRLMSTINFSVRADGSLPCVITLPSEYEAESHDTASLWDIATPPRPTPPGSPAGHREEELPATSHTAPGDAAAHPTRTPVPGEAEEPQREPEQEAAPGPSAQGRSPTAAKRGRDRSARGSHRPRKRRARSARGTSQPCKRPPPRHH